MGTQWSDVLTFEISIMKDSCVTDADDLNFTEDEVDEINAWLTSPDYPILLHIYDATDATYNQGTDTYTNYQYLKYNYFGLFSDIQPMMLEGYIVGLRMVFTTNSPFAWTDEIVRTFSCMPGNTPTQISFNVNHSERNREIFPVVIFNAKKQDELLGDVDFKITNLIDNNIIQLSLRKEDPITIDARHTMIRDTSGLLSFSDLGIGDLEYIYWPKLYHGTNSFEVEVSPDNTESPVEVTFKYREARKVGAY